MKMKKKMVALAQQGHQAAQMQISDMASWLWFWFAPPEVSWC
jgi:hypothetical protein